MREVNVVKGGCSVKLNLDGHGKALITTSDSFLDAMLKLLAREALFDLDISAKRSSLSTLGEVFGKAFKKAYGDGLGTRMEYTETVPIESNLTLVALELRSNPYFKFEKELHGDMKENYDEFFNGFVESAGVRLHIMIPDKVDRKDMFISVFTGLGICLGIATSKNPDAKYALKRNFQ